MATSRARQLLARPRRQPLSCPAARCGATGGSSPWLPPLIAQSEFAREDVARVIALIVATAQAAYAFAPAIFGALRTVPLALAAPGEAPIFFAAAALIQAVAIGCLLAGRRRRFSGP